MVWYGLRITDLFKALARFHPVLAGTNALSLSLSLPTLLSLRASKNNSFNGQKWLKVLLISSFPLRAKLGLKCMQLLVQMA